MNDELPEDEHARRLADVLHTLKPTPSEAAEISELARHTDPWLAAQTWRGGHPLRERLSAENDRSSQVVWVRPTELLPSASARMIGRGIDLRTELARRVEERRQTSPQATPVTRPGIRARAQGIAPLSAFGQSPAHQSSVSRDALRGL